MRVAFSPDGKTLATASYDGRVGLFGSGPRRRDDLSMLTSRGWGGRIGRVRCQRHQASERGVLRQDRPPVGPDHRPAQADPRVRTEAQAELLWAALSPDDRLVAAVGRGRQGRESTRQTTGSCFAASLATSRRSIAPSSAPMAGSWPRSAPTPPSGCGIWTRAPSCSRSASPPTGRRPSRSGISISAARPPAAGWRSRSPAASSRSTTSGPTPSERASPARNEWVVPAGAEPVSPRAGRRASWRRRASLRP